MRLIAPSSIEEMVLAFLRAEASSSRWKDAFAKLDRRLIDQPDLGDAAQNRARADALATHRGDVRTRTGYFGGLPQNTVWRRWGMTPGELGEVRYANYVTWVRLSGGTRRIRDGAASLSQLRVVENGNDINAGARATAHLIDEGLLMPELIAVAQNPDGRDLVLMEGHMRATAYQIARKPPAEVILLVGCSSAMAEWPWF